jgi:ABC-type nitrate/sulfonate/bicarbonate transport system permease component
VPTSSITSPTFAEAFAAAGIGSLIGVAVGYTLHRVKIAGRAFTGWVAASASAPLVLLYPLFLVIFGRNSATIVAMGVVGCMPPIILKTKEGLDNVRPVLLNIGRSFGLTPWKQFWMIQFPAALPTISAPTRRFISSLRPMPAPALVSTITWCPKRSDSFAATSRDVMSAPPNGATGTIMRMGLAGQA